MSSNEPPEPPKSSKGKWKPGKPTRAQDNKKARKAMLDQDSSSRSGGIERPQEGEKSRAARAAAQTTVQEEPQVQLASPLVGSAGLQPQPAGQPASQPRSGGEVASRPNELPTDAVEEAPASRSGSRGDGASARPSESTSGIAKGKGPVNRGSSSSGAAGQLGGRRSPEEQVGPSTSSVNPAPGSTAPWTEKMDELHASITSQAAMKAIQDASDRSGLTAVIPGGGVAKRLTNDVYHGRVPVPGLLWYVLNRPSDEDLVDGILDAATRLREILGPIDDDELTDEHRARYDMWTNEALSQITTAPNLVLRLVHREALDSLSASMKELNVSDTCRQM